MLLADGRTSREAAAPFLSPKTVDYHLRKTCAKLGIMTQQRCDSQTAFAWLRARS